MVCSSSKGASRCHLTKQLAAGSIGWWNIALSPVYHMPQRVIADRDLARLYGVRPIALRQQVKRNRERFPPDFMFQLTATEAQGLVSQSVIPSRRSLGGFLPYVFTEHGVAMLSAVLHSERATQMSIAVILDALVIEAYAQSLQLKFKSGLIDGRSTSSNLPAAPLGTDIRDRYDSYVKSNGGSFPFRVRGHEC